MRSPFSPLKHQIIVLHQQVLTDSLGSYLQHIHFVVVFSHDLLQFSSSSVCSLTRAPNHRRILTMFSWYLKCWGAVARSAAKWSFSWAANEWFRSPCHCRSRASHDTSCKQTDSLCDSNASASVDTADASLAFLSMTTWSRFDLFCAALVIAKFYSNPSWASLFFDRYFSGLFTTQNGPKIRHHPITLTAKLSRSTAHAINHLIDDLVCSVFDCGKPRQLLSRSMFANEMVYAANYSRVAPAWIDCTASQLQTVDINAVQSDVMRALSTATIDEHINHDWIDRNRAVCVLVFGLKWREMGEWMGRPTPVDNQWMVVRLTLYALVFRCKCSDR